MMAYARVFDRQFHWAAILLISSPTGPHADN